MVYYYVACTDPKAIEPLVLSPYYEKYSDVYNDFVKLGGLDRSSHLAIDTLSVDVLDE